MDHHLAAEVAQVVAARDDFIDDANQLARVLIGDRLKRLIERLNIDESQRGRHILIGHRAARKANDLIERRFRISHRAFTGARDRQQRRLADANPLFLGY